MSNEEKFNKSKIHCRGKFIVIDGCEGAGKSTLIKLAKEELRNNFIFVREPGGTELAERIRADILSNAGRDLSPETQFLLFWSARADHMSKIIIPALSSGKNVICDRFDSSTYAYQVFSSKNKYLKDFFWNMRKAILGKWTPDIYVFLDVLPEEGLKRVEKRKEKKTHFDEREIDFHRKIRKGFLNFLKNVPHRIIDANLNLEIVRGDFIYLVESFIKGKFSTSFPQGY